MRLLLDTHTFLWFALSDPQLSGTAMALILDSANEKLVSPASYWEIAPLEVTRLTAARFVVRRSVSPGRGSAL